MSSIPCFAWWFVAGLFGGWLLWWLIDRLFLRNGDAAARLAGLEAAQEAAKAKEARLAAEFEEQRGQLAAAQTRLTDTTSQLDHYATLETAYNTEYAKILKERDGLKAQLNSSTGEITRLNSEHTSADHEIEASHGQITALQEQLRAARAQIESLTGEAGGRTQDLKTLQSKLAAATANSAGLQSQIPSLQMEIARLKEDLEKAAQRGAYAADLKADADATRGTLNAQSAEIERLKRELAAAAGYAPEIARLKDLVTVKTRGEEAAARQVAELKALVGAQRDSSSDIARLKAEIDAAHGENQRLDKELHVAQEWLTRTGTELETSRSAHGTANGEIARLKEHITSLNEQIGQYERLRSALEAARQAADLGLNLGKKS